MIMETRTELRLWAALVLSALILVTWVRLTTVAEPPPASPVQEATPKTAPVEEQVTVCNGPRLDEVTQMLWQSGTVTKVDSNRSVPRIYVGGAWYGLTVDQKKGAAYALICQAYNKRVPTDVVVVFHDSYSGAKIAEFGALGLRIFK